MTAPHAVPTTTDVLQPRAPAERALEDALTMPPRYSRDHGQERTVDIEHRDREATRVRLIVSESISEPFYVSPMILE